jgi:hypothetical protein
MTFQSTTYGKGKVAVERICNIGLVVVLIWGIILSLIVRPGLALNQRESRDMGILMNAGKAWIGYGKHTVLLGAIEEYSQAREFYYVGRSLNWRMFSPQGHYDDESFHKLCLSMKYAILRSPVNWQTAAKLKKAGLCHLVTVTGHHSDKTKDNGKEFYNGAQLYGPYEMYSRCTSFLIPSKIYPEKAQ